MPENDTQVEAILATTTHVHTVEQAYSELCEKVPGIQETFSQQYNDWFKQQEKKEHKRTGHSIIRRLVGLFTSKNEQEKHS